MDYPAGLFDRFDFGTFEGETVAHVIETRPEYITECYEEVENFELTPVAKQYLKDVLEEEKLSSDERE